jgi:hypothetical protein
MITPTLAMTRTKAADPTVMPAISPVERLYEGPLDCEVLAVCKAPEAAEAEVEDKLGVTIPDVGLLDAPVGPNPCGGEVDESIVLEGIAPVIVDVRTGCTIIVDVPEVMVETTVTVAINSSRTTGTSCWPSIQEQASLVS